MSECKDNFLKSLDTSSLGNYLYNYIHITIFIRLYLYNYIYITIFIKLIIKLGIKAKINDLNRMLR